MFSYKELSTLVFDASIDADEIVIITGYIGPAIIGELKNSPYKARIYVGMYGNNISTHLHMSLLRNNALPNVDIFYTRSLVHSKCYIWRKNGKIIKALIGSANFSTSGLMTPEKEVLGDLAKNDFSKVTKYMSVIFGKAYPITDYEYSSDNAQAQIPAEEAIATNGSLAISLLAGKGVGVKNIVGVNTVGGGVHSASGLNWGFSNGDSSPNDAYIKITSAHVRNNPLLFPQKNSEKNMPIDVVWDDGTEMQMLLEGNQTVDGVIYPKQISTYKNKAEVGIYLRKRIGEKIGVDLSIPEELSKADFVANAATYKEKLITREMLDKYGRTSITIKLIGDRTYYFDFSPIEE